MTDKPNDDEPRSYPDPSILPPEQRAALDAEIDALPPLTDEQIDIIVAIIIATRDRDRPARPDPPNT